MTRICMIAYSGYVYDARIRKEAEALAARGDQVDCICLPHAGVARGDEVEGVALYPVRIPRYRGQSTWLYLLSYVLFFAGAFLLVTLRHLRLRYHVVQVHTMPDFMVFAAAVPRLLGAGLILDVHDLMPELYMSKFGLNRDHWIIRIITAVERVSIGFAHRAIAVHEPHLQALASHGNPAERFEILLNSPDPAVFGRRNQRNARPRIPAPFRLVYHGTISRRHGLELAIRAVLAARMQISDLRLTIIGSGDDRARLMSLVEELGLGRSVEFGAESVPVSDLPGLLAEADLGIVPLKRDSFTQYMLPVKMMEYVTLGIPVIVTRTATIERYFDDSMVQYVSGDSVDELARAIVELHQDPDRRERMVRNAREFDARNNWDEQKLVYYRLIDSVAARSPKSQRGSGNGTLAG